MLARSVTGAARTAAAKWLRPYRAATAGGEAVMHRFSDDPDEPCFTGDWWKPDKNRFHQARGPGGAKRYVLNPNLWIYAFRDSLSAVTVANEWKYPGNTVPGEGWGSKRGSTLVTPQHILSCGHGAAGPVGPTDYPTRCRFLGTDGETYERTVIGQKLCLYGYPVVVNGVSHTGDSCISTLDSPLPPAVIPVRSIPNHFKFTSRYAAWDGLFVSQSVEMDVPSPTSFGEQVNWYPLNQPFPVSHYPRRHRTLCGLVWSHDPKVGYVAWGGDSGMPLFYAYGTELLLAGFAGGGGVGANGYPRGEITWEALVNQMILDADADAIARGSLTTLTGYTLSLANEIPDLLPQ